MLNRKLVNQETDPILFAHKTSAANGVYRRSIDDTTVGESIVDDGIKLNGEVIGVTNHTIVISHKRNYFSIIEKTLAGQMPDIGDFIEIVPYVRNGFNGQPMRKLVKADTQFMDGLFLYMNSCLLGDDQVRIPGDKVHNPVLLNLICQLQETKLSDGFRKITNLFVDVGANNFRVVDPKDDEELSQGMPSIRFNVPGPKFKGDVEIIVDCATDTYSVNFYGDEVRKCDFVHFDELAKVLEDALDDGLWKQIKVNVISKAKPKRKAA